MPQRTIALLNRFHRGHDLHYRTVDLGAAKVKKEPLADRHKADCYNFASANRSCDIDKIDIEVVVHGIGVYGLVFLASQSGFSCSSCTEPPPKFFPRCAEYHGVPVPFLRRNTTHRRVESLIKQGIGIQETTWDLAGDGQPGPTPMVERILAWVREAMGGMRRPYGIDHVALALACRDANGKVLSTSSLGVIRPASFYGEEGRERIASFLADVEFVRAEHPVELVGALLSLGDLAFELEHARAA